MIRTSIPRTGVPLLEQLDRFSRRMLGMRVVWPLTLVIVACVAGAAIGWRFPKFEATAMLQFPDTTDKQNIVDLQTYKRVAASYDSPLQLAAYLKKADPGNLTAGELLLEQARGRGFWGQHVAPVLPFTRRDQRQFGDLKDIAVNTLIGVNLNALSSSPIMAGDMVRLLANYVADAVVRERIRTWVLSNKVQSASADRKLRAEIMRIQLEIELNQRRAESLKTIMARHPEATRADERQIIGINRPEGADHVFSPLAQLFKAESTILQHQEVIARLERQRRQMLLLAPYYAAAEELVHEIPQAGSLIAALTGLADRLFPESRLEEDWAAEAVLHIKLLLGLLGEFRNQIDIRTDVQLNSIATREPARLFLVGGALALGLLVVLALMRSIRFTNFDEEIEDLQPAQSTSTAPVRGEGSSWAKLDKADPARDATPPLHDLGRH